jgi:hypothetical protein
MPRQLGRPPARDRPHTLRFRAAHADAEDLTHDQTNHDQAYRPTAFQNPTDAAWRARQAQVDADIEGLHRDAGIDQFVANMEAEGVAPREKVQSLSETLVRCASQASWQTCTKPRKEGYFCARLTRHLDALPPGLAPER